MNRLKTLLSIATLVGAATTSQAITFTFVPTLSVLPGGGTFTAEVTILDTAIGAPFGTLADVTAFSASLSGNSFAVPNKAWEFDELSFATFVLTSGHVLNFSGLQATDNDAAGSGTFLNGGATGFSAPTTIGGSWVEKKATENRVPDGGMTAALLGLGVLGLGMMRKTA